MEVTPSSVLGAHLAGDGHHRLLGEASVELPRGLVHLLLDEDALGDARAVAEHRERHLAVTAGGLDPAAHGDRLADVPAQILDLHHAPVRLG